MDVLARLDETRAEHDVLRHPFYQRWSAGQLRAEELARYAGEYRHAVGALATASTMAADCSGDQHAPTLARHAEEETVHIILWEQFASACGADAPGREPLAETRECVRAWTAGESLLEHLAILYAVEAGQPDISATKLDGLLTHYGHREEGPATEYFRLHRELDVEHADEARTLIADLIAQERESDGAAERMVARAREALQGNWLLLDGVDAAR